jgi:hypothetical protein
VLRAHQTVALLVLAGAAIAVVVGGVAYRRGGSATGAARHLLALVQTLLVAQVALGLLLLSDGRRAADELHYAYGTLALGAVLAPWIYAPAEPRRRLLWFVGATLLAGLLAGRAYMTAG